MKKSRLLLEARKTIYCALLPVDRLSRHLSCMTIRKQKSGRYYAIVKIGRTFVGGKTFDTRREAQAWLDRERAAIAGGVDRLPQVHAFFSDKADWIEVSDELPRRGGVSGTEPLP